MKITKFGHSCLLVEENGVRILIDPGCLSDLSGDMTGIDAVLITHEHADHFDVDFLWGIMAQSFVTVYTNAGVGEKLQAENIEFETISDGQVLSIKGVKVEAVGKKHALVYKTLPICDNTGFLIADKFFHPGDSLTMSLKPIEILALPVAAPWMNLSEMLDYGLAVKPKVIIPIHDGFLKESNPYYPHAEREFKVAGIEWRVLKNGETMEL